MTALRAVRLSKGITQAWMAKQLGIHRMTYMNYEMGHSAPPRSVIFHAAHLLNVPVHEIETDIQRQPDGVFQ